MSFKHMTMLAFCASTLACAASSSMSASEAEAQNLPPRTIPGQAPLRIEQMPPRQTPEQVRPEPFRAVIGMTRLWPGSATSAIRNMERECASIARAMDAGLLHHAQMNYNSELRSGKYGARGIMFSLRLTGDQQRFGGTWSEVTADCYLWHQDELGAGYRPFGWSQDWRY